MAANVFIAMTVMESHYHFTAGFSNQLELQYYSLLQYSCDIFIDAAFIFQGHKQTLRVRKGEHPNMFQHQPV